MKTQTMDREPMVTVIMPIRNEAQFITCSLGAVLAQDYPAEKLEVLVTDGMSTDGTLDIIREMAGAERVRVVPNAKLKQASGLNLAIPQARGTVVIRVDGHTIIALDYVRECVRALAETGAANVGGPMDPVGTTPMGKAIAAAGKSAFAVPTSFHVSDQAQFTDTVYMGAWPKTIFEQVGLYNEIATTNEDYELNYRIRMAGGKIYLSPRIRSQYFGRQTLRALARQYFSYGVGKVEVLQRHPKSLKPRHVVAPAFVLGATAGAVLALVHPVFLALWILGLGAYAALNVLFSVKVARQAGMGLLGRLPLVFLTIHLVWGVGFWVAAGRTLSGKR